MKNLNLLVLSLLSIMLFSSCDQLEDIFLGGENNEITESSGLYYVQNETEGMDMITDNVDHILFIETDPATQERTIKGGRMDTKSEKCVEEEVFVIYMDSLNRVSTILLDNMMCNFYNYTETTCDIVFINIDETYYSVEKITLPQEKFALHKTRSTSGEEFIDNATKVIGGVKASFELALSICKNPDKLRKALDAFDYMSEMMSGGWKFGTSSATMGINAKLYNLRPDLFSLCMYLIETGRTLSDFLTEQLIGNWALELISIEQVNEKTAKIVFSVSGIKENPSVELSGYVWYKNMDNRRANNISFNVANKTYTMLLPFDSYGRFFGRISLLGAFGFGKYKSFEFNAYNLDLSKYEIEENPLYKNGEVNFKMNIFLKGNEDDLKDIQQFGYYIKYANAIDYKEVKNLSSIFESTPLTYELSIPRDGFSDETINYTTFEAKPSIDYYIGVYVVLKNGNIVHFDEENIEGLVYNRKPSFTISNIVVTDRGPYSDEDSGWDSYMSYTVDYAVDGGLFVTEIYEKYGENWTSSGSEYLICHEYNDKDKYTMNGTIVYSSKNPKVSPISFYAVLKNGAKYQFNQGMIFQGGSLSVTGGTRSISFTQTPTYEYPKPLIIIED